MATKIIRRMLRLPNPEDHTSLDSMLVNHLERLEEDSPQRAQEWMRLALRNQLEREMLIKKFGNGEFVNEA